jgi:hypothetical protein
LDELSLDVLEDVRILVDGEQHREGHEGSTYPLARARPPLVPLVDREVFTAPARPTPALSMVIGG